MADHEVHPIPTPAGPGDRRARLFLMVAGGLAAPSLALAAFFFTSNGESASPARPPKAQAGQMTGTTAPGRPSSGGAAPATTSTTVGPLPPANPPRDPFAPLVSQPPAGGSPAR